MIDVAMQDLTVRSTTATMAPAPLPVPPPPARARTISGQTYRFGTNPLGLETFALRFDRPDEATLTGCPFPNPGYSRPRHAGHPFLQELIDLGLFVPYREKSQAGLLVADSSGQPFFKALSPGRVYANFAAVPAVVVKSLLYIENRDLLDPSHARKNPAVEWARLGKAVQDKAIQLFRPEHDVTGGSTLSMQIEKYRHSPNWCAGSRKRSPQPLGMRAKGDLRASV